MDVCLKRPNRSHGLYFRVLAEAAHPLVTLKLAGLAEEATYQMEDVTFAGDELMNLGFILTQNYMVIMRHNAFI